MHAREIAFLICIFASLFTSLLPCILLPFVLSGERWRAAEEKARARRLADAKMNARLLRFNL